jgi:FkbM family methyltransferase
VLSPFPLFRGQILAPVLKLLRRMDIRDENGFKVDIENIEKMEQDLAKFFVQPDDIVLELGARYGSVSCIINSKLTNKRNQVVVEPDDRVWSALERNKEANNCEFHIIKGFISSKKLGLVNLNDHFKGYAATFVEQNESNIPSFTLDEIKNMYNLNFNVLVADCEGFLEEFFDQNPSFYDGLKTIIFEADYPEKCNYTKIRNTLQEKGFRRVIEGFQNLWIKK